MWETQTAVIPDTGACLQQHKVRSLVNQAGTQPMLQLLGLALCTWSELSIYHGYDQQPPEMSCSPSRAARAILSPVTWIKTKEQGLNEKQIRVASVLPSQWQESKVYLPSWKPGSDCPLQPCRYRWADAQCSPRSIPACLGFTESTSLPQKHRQS